VKFSAYDIINKKPIDLYKIILSSCGGIIAFQDLNGDQYGPHQIHLSVDVTDLNNETVIRNTGEKYYYDIHGFVKGDGWCGIQNVKVFDKVLAEVLIDEEIKRLDNHIKQQEVHMQKYEAPQKIDPGVLTLRWNEDEMKEIMLEHIKNTGIDVSDFAEASFWHEEESSFIAGANCPPHYGFVMRITKKIK